LSGYKIWAYTEQGVHSDSGTNRPVFFHMYYFFYVVLNIAWNDRFVLR